MISSVNRTQAGAAGTERGNPAAKPARADAGSTSTSGSAGVERVSLSSRAVLAGKVLAAAQQSDGIDHARVALLQEAINSGAYELSAEATAAGILDALSEPASSGGST